MKSEALLFEECKLKVAEKSNLGQIKDWNFYHFKRLNEQIHESTQILISPRTLRRIYGKDASIINYTPQIETKNALAKFLGYSNWNDYLISNGAKESTLNINYKKNKPKKFLHYLIYSLMFIVFCAILFFILSKNSDYSSIRFYSNDSIGESPLNVTFIYNISKIKTNNIYIDYDYQKGKYLLSKDNNKLNHSYKYSGIYNPKIIISDKIIKVQKIIVFSKGWEGIILDDQSLYNVRLWNDSTSNGIMQISKDEIDFIGSRLNKKELWSKFLNFKDYNISLDNLTYEARVKGDFEHPENKCSNLRISLIGSNNKIQLVFSKQGCLNYIQVKISDIFLNGENFELPKFQIDISNWHLFKIITNNKRTEIYLDNKKINIFNYSQLMGKLYGLEFKIQDRGAVDWVKVKDNKSGIEFFDDFTNN